MTANRDSGTRQPRLGPDGLTAKERKFCALLMRGKTKTDAYLIAFGRGRKSQQSIWEAACRVSKRPQVLARLDQLIAETDQADMDSRQQALADLQSDIEAARETGHWSAVAALTDRRLRALGMLSDRIVLDRESRMSDDQLVNALAGHNEQLAQELRTLLHGSKGFDEHGHKE